MLCLIVAHARKGLLDKPGVNVAEMLVFPTSVGSRLIVVPAATPSLLYISFKELPPSLLATVTVTRVLAGANGGREQVFGIVTHGDISGGMNGSKAPSALSLVGTALSH